MCLCVEELLINHFEIVSETLRVNKNDLVSPSFPYSSFSAKAASAAKKYFH
jgi:hypothetical protein